MKKKNLLLVASAITSGCCTVGLQARDNQKPNILLICADDLGWSDIGCYGSEVNTPNLDALAKNGVRFASFHNTSKSFPSRACLLTGLYAQQTGYGETFRAPLANGITLGELLRETGYITLWSGKHHGQENPVTRGFDHYYGLMGGACNYFNPGCQREGEGVPAQTKHNWLWSIDDKEYAPYTPAEKDFYTTDYFTNYALQWLDQYKDNNQPFFLYLAYNAPHYPLMAWPEDIAKYKGKYKDGYEAIRIARYEKQLKMGLIDQRYQLSAPTFEPWESLSPGQKAIEERKMEVYAAMIDRLDQNIGKVMDKLREQGQLDHTIILFMSDNGASAESANLDSSYGEIGTLTHWTSIGENWANVCNTPFRYYKNYSYEGGIATPLIISWPHGLKEPNRISNFTGHFIDIMATFVELTGAEYPAEFAGKKVLPFEGVSLMPVVRNEKVERARPIGWEWAYGQAIRDGRWKLVRQGLNNIWSLFDMYDDPVEVNDIAEKNPQQVEKMAILFQDWQKRVTTINPGLTLAQKGINLDESKVPDYILPDLLTCNDGKKVTTVKQWEKQRHAELLEVFASQMYGRTPQEKIEVDYETLSENPVFLNGKATCKQVKMTFHNGTKKHEAVLMLVLPNHTKGKVPVIISYNYRGNHSTIADTAILLPSFFALPQTPDYIRFEDAWRERGNQSARWIYDKIIDRGYGVATMFYQDIYPDRAGYDELGIVSLFSGYNPDRKTSDQWQALGAWAWGFSRIADYLETEKRVDKKKFIIMGHSRHGKAALWAGAQDKRFKIVISNESGCGGAALSNRVFGQHIADITSVFPHWFCPAFNLYANNEASMPFDQHALVALIAPRHAYIASAKENVLADPKGEFLTAYHAGPIYKLYGLKGLDTNVLPPVHQPIMNDMGYHIRDGVHDVTEYDWLRFMDFADKHFGQPK